MRDDELIPVEWALISRKGKKTPDRQRTGLAGARVHGRYHSVRSRTGSYREDPESFAKWPSVCGEWGMDTTQKEKRKQPNREVTLIRH